MIISGDDLINMNGLFDVVHVTVSSSTLDSGLFVFGAHVQHNYVACILIVVEYYAQRMPVLCSHYGHR